MNKITDTERQQILNRAIALVKQHGQTRKVRDLLMSEFGISKGRASRAYSRALRLLVPKPKRNQDTSKCG